MVYNINSEDRGYSLPSFLAILVAVYLGLVGDCVRATTFDLPENGDVIGEMRSVVARHEDTLADIARRYDLGYDQISRANPGVDPWVPGEGTRIVLPTQFILPDAPRESLVLNLPEMRLYYYPKAEPGQRRKVITHPVGIGREGWNTPLGKTEVVRKEPNPTWYPPESIRKEHAADGDVLPQAVPPGPQNPLGQFALYLGFKGYLIHGTDKPYGIGMRVSHGCMRLYPEDIASLFTKVAVKTPVYVIDQPFKAGWRDGQLYLEAHPPLAEQEDGPADTSLTPLVRAITAKAGNDERMLDWTKAMAVATDPRGIPVPILGDTVAVDEPSATPRGPVLGGPVLASLERSFPLQEGTPRTSALSASRAGNDPESDPGDDQASPAPDATAPVMDVPDVGSGLPGPWFIQVGAFHQADNAERLAFRLQNLAPPVPALHSAQNGVYRVIAGPFFDRNEADLIARRITSYFQIETRLLPASAQQLAR